MIRRTLTEREALAWQTSAPFRKAVKGQLVCQALDGEDDHIEIVVFGVVAYSMTVTNDDEQEFFDATEWELGAIERELLATLP